MERMIRWIKANMELIIIIILLLAGLWVGVPVFEHFYKPDKQEEKLRRELEEWKEKHLKLKEESERNRATLRDSIDSLHVWNKRLRVEFKEYEKDNEKAKNLLHGNVSQLDSFWSNGANY